MKTKKRLTITALAQWLTIALMALSSQALFAATNATAEQEGFYMVGWLNNWNSNDKSLPLTRCDDGQTWEITVAPTDTEESLHGWFKIAPASAYGNGNFWDQLLCAPYDGCQELEGTMTWGGGGAWKLPRDRETASYTIRVNPTTMRYQIQIEKREYRPWSGTLPVLHIDTQQEVTSKETYVEGTYYIDALGLEGYESLGSAEEPLPLQIKGRGNYTWSSFQKKPYRLKLGEKARPLGMKASRHFTLLAHADDDLAWLRNTVGFELSRQMGLAYTPEQQPVEVMMNGEYRGLYMLTDKIRVAKNRVDITEQADNETDPALVTGGWLVEIDNYNEDTQVRIKESNGEMLRFTCHSPEVLSEVQRQYLTQLMTTADHAIYNPDKTDTAWEQLIDMDVLARYYIVQELMDDAESFHGSCYIYKDRGDDTRLMFGPVWDFGNTFRRSLHHFIYDNPPYGQNWIGEIAKFPRFQQRVRELWQHYLAHGEPVMHDFIDDFISQIAAAAVTDAQRWPQYSQADTAQRATEFKRRLNEKTSFLKSQWGDLDVGITTIATGKEASETDNNWYLPDGRRLQAKPEKKGMYIHHGKLVVVGR